MYVQGLLDNGFAEDKIRAMVGEHARAIGSLDRRGAP